jgi:hypothetical protein
MTNTPRTKRTFKVGDIVGMCPAFLRDVHDNSASSARQRGFVSRVSPITHGRTLVQVQWSDGHVSTSLNVNLIHAA